MGESCKHGHCAMGLNLLFLTIEFCKEPMEKTFIPRSNSTNSSDIWINNKVFDVVIFESVVGFATIVVGHLFSEMRKQSVKCNVFLIVEEVLNIGSCDQHTIFIFSIFEFFDKR